MSRKSVISLSLTGFFFVALSLLAFLGSGMVLASEDNESRTSVSRHHVTGGRDNPAAVAETEEEYDALLTTGVRGQANTRGSASKGSGDLQKGNWDFWIYDADVILFNDADQDGYYYGIDLLFDADTFYSSAGVYAVLYLSYEGGPWNEYAVTEDFTINGASSDDEYVIVTELMSGYKPGSYDLLIELFDSWDGTFLASFGPADSSELSYLPLEDFNFDLPQPPPEVIVVSEGGGGSVDGWLLGAFLLILFVGGARRIWRRRNDTLMRIDSPAPCWQAPLSDRQRTRNF